jgi:hypothetical protein
MAVGKGPNWGCRAKEKKATYHFNLCYSPIFIRVSFLNLCFYVINKYCGMSYCCLTAKKASNNTRLFFIKIKVKVVPVLN